MRVFRTTYKGRDGKHHAVPKWCIELRGTDGQVRRISAYEDKAASKELAYKLHRLAELKEVREVPTGELLPGLETRAEPLTGKLSKKTRVASFDCGLVADLDGERKVPEQRRSTEGWQCVLVPLSYHERVEVQAAAA